MYIMLEQIQLVADVVYIIHDAIPFKQRKDLKLGGKSVFIEVNGKIINTNKNVILAVL